MKCKVFGMVAVVIFAVGLLGCASMSDVVKAKSDGTVEVYPVSSEQAWEIARTVFRWEGTEAIEEHKAEGYMLTSSGMNFISAGAFMGAWIEALDKNKTRVTVVTKRRVATNIATTLTESTFHKRFAQAVAIVKNGKSLPSEPPE
ncbi:MAG: hypothetical protein A2077_02620 [Nitrospirae bacterium GWC2_46_6]|nr:MAG: hypothetical protein A2077_02620 [Nitrospirae bacterium GWC2_46_6]OGW20471.1 MAG: hypothetical protein A2Z82_05300 [Nitrospirae bacterium GWA2_46_11]HAK89853.1 hypothetical protein [Nitrospiraceae bacterium]HCL80993.1 hypothetical protein [Nitrospiraceae bacterium]